jgi:hypothetical protein
MKLRSLSMVAALATVALLIALFPPHFSVVAQTPGSPSGSEYATVRWAGRENTHIIRPGGKVEFIGPELRKFSRPDRCDERSFYMNIALNGLVKEGWEFAGMTPDEIVMRRPLSH